MKALYLTVASVLLLVAPANGAPIDFNKNGSVDPFEDPATPIDDRVEDLLSQMTVEEKTCQCTTLYGYPRVLMDSEPTPGWKKRVWKDGIGNIDEHCNGYGNRRKVLKGPPSEIPATLNKTQRWFVEETRLGVPAEFTNEGMRGACVTGGTSFPAQLNLGCSWDRDLLSEVGRVVATENRALGYTNTYAPILDLPRDPRWGRMVECYGEEPYLVSELGVRMVKGLQANGTSSTLKHYAVYAVPEGGRDDKARTAPSVGFRELHTLYMRPFRRAIQEAGARGVMSSYNDYDGEVVTASKYFLIDLLRKEYGFDGYVVSDSEAVEFVFTKHRIAATYKEAVAKTLIGGMNVRTTFRQPETFTLPLRQAVADGLLPMADLDQRVREVLRYKFKVGLFDQPYVEDPAAADSVVGSEEHQAIAKRASGESIVLLKNDGLLPLDLSKHSKVLLAGPNLHGDHFGVSRYGPQRIEVPDMEASMRATFGDRVEFLTAKGCGIVDANFPESDILPADPNDKEQALIDEAVAAAQQCDLAVLFLGGHPDKTVGESYSRTSLRLPGHQETLLKAIHATGTPVVLVLVDGRPTTINWADRHVPAIVFAGFGGQHGGAALAETLLGEINPSGKTTVTWPKHVGQVPYAFPYKPWSRSAGRARVDGALYPFGHGLSYTSFAYSDLEIANHKPSLGEPVTVRCKISNTGSITGAEVAQLYLKDLVASVNRSAVELSGFERVKLAPGESKTVEFTISDEQLQLMNLDNEWVVEPGRFAVYIGASSEDIRLPAPKAESGKKAKGNTGFPIIQKKLTQEPSENLAANEFEVQP